jgi:putative transposase
MKEIIKTYKIRLYPNVEQRIFLAKHFGCVRFVYNYFLNRRNEYYRENKKGLNYYDTCRELTELKKEDGKEWLKECNSQTLQTSLNNLDIAFNRFFKKQSNFPKFKSKSHRQSFTIPQNFFIEDNRIFIPKLNSGIKFVESNKIKGTPRFFVISKTPSNEYYVSITCEQEYKPYKKSKLSIGIDLGLKDFLVTSDGKKYKNPKHFKKYERRLAKAQKHLSKKQKGSNRYNDQRLKVARIYEKITNSRVDNLHKVSTEIVKKYGIICVEDLNIKGMVRNKHLSKHISDVSWGMFINMLKYKSDWNDRMLIKIDRFYPSSKTCSNCGYINYGLKLQDRNWECPKCHTMLDRDLSAAKNILREGLNNLVSAGSVEYTRGAKIRPDVS